MKYLKTATRYLHSIRYLKPSQVLYRVILKIFRAAFSNKIVSDAFFKLNGLKQNVLELKAEFKLPSSFDPKDFLQELNFLNEPIKPDGTWLPSKASLLWLFNLHYFDYLNNLQESASFQALVIDWINKVPVGNKIVWHPYPTSRRIANWIIAYHRHQNELSEHFKEVFLNSLKKQILFLNWNLEFDLTGNHLISNLKALCIGAVLFSDLKLQSRALNFLNTALKEQILVDGGHYERSPMYHLIVLEDLLEILDALVRNKLEVPHFLIESISLMCSYCEIVFADNSFPLLNDSSSEIAISSENLLQRAYALNIPILKKDKPGLTFLKESGLVVYRGEKILLFFDVGPIGPDHLPGHAHNDTLSVLLFYSGKEVLTDSGTFTYLEGPDRLSFKSSKAHNVATIANTEPNDIWKSFRVGERHRPHSILAQETEFQATYSAYKKLGLDWTRKVVILENEMGIEVIDSFEPLTPNSASLIPIDIKFHFAEQFFKAEIENNYPKKDSGNAISLFSKDLNFQILTDTQRVILEIQESWISREFNKKTKRICVNARLDHPMTERLTIGFRIVVI